LVTINCNPFHYVIVADDETACPQCVCITVFELKSGAVTARAINIYNTNLVSLSTEDVRVGLASPVSRLIDTNVAVEAAPNPFALVQDLARRPIEGDHHLI